MKKNKAKFLYCTCHRIKEIWIEDFVDDDTQEVIRIDRTEYDYITTFIGIIDVSHAKSKLTKPELEDYARLTIKLRNKDIRFSKLITQRRYEKYLEESKNHKGSFKTRKVFFL